MYRTRAQSNASLWAAFSPGLLQLGDRGPWLVDRLIGAREMPADLDTAGKVDMVAQSVLHACSHGSAHVELHKHVCSRILAWASDGADLATGHAATSHFQNMSFREWEESHSAAKLLEHAVKNHEEARVVDSLLVSGAASAPRTSPTQKPQSLAKFLSKSEVFRKCPCWAMFPDYLKSRKCGVTFQARNGGATSVPAKVMKCVVLAAQCTVGVSSMLEPVTPDTVPVQDLTCDLKGDRYDSFISMRMFCIISAILWITGFMTGVIVVVCVRYFRSSRTLSDVASQSPTTYTALRGVTTLRFLPLPDLSWG